MRRSVPSLRRDSQAAVATRNWRVATVANISLGDSDSRSDDQRCGLVNHDPFHTAICRGTRRGVLYVASAMNDSSPFTTTVPAAYDEVLTVTGAGYHVAPSTGLNCTIRRRVALPNRFALSDG